MSLLSALFPKLTRRTREDGYISGQNVALHELRTRTDWTVDGNWYSVKGRWLYVNFQEPEGSYEFRAGYRRGWMDVANAEVGKATGTYIAPLGSL